MMKYSLQILIYCIIAIVNLSCDSEKINGSKPGENESDPVTITDIEGNLYHTVRIGNQLWTIENLRTTRYKDGTPIPFITEDSAWKAATSGAYCSYLNTEISDTIRKYGFFYNWYAVATGKLAPDGWRVPSKNDWDKLRDYLITNGYNWDSTSHDNKIAKAISSQTDWKSCETDGTIGKDLTSNNKSGFSALPAGSRSTEGIFGNRGLMNHWWSSTPTYASRVFSVYITYEDQEMVVHNHLETCGFVVRIVKN